VRPRAKVTIDSLKKVAYEKPIGDKMNDLDLSLEVVSRSHDEGHVHVHVRITNKLSVKRACAHN